VARWNCLGACRMAPIAIIRAVTSLQISTSLARKSKIRTSPRLPVAPVEAPNKRGVTLIPDAAEILGEAQRAGVNLILHGHQHKPKLSLYQDLPLNGGQLFDGCMSLPTAVRVPGKPDCPPESEILTASSSSDKPESGFGCASSVWTESPVLKFIKANCRRYQSLERIALQVPEFS
jgi:hypothetical protein